MKEKQVSLGSVVVLRSQCSHHGGSLAWREGCSLLLGKASRPCSAELWKRPQLLSHSIYLGVINRKTHVLHLQEIGSENVCEVI